MNAGNGVESNSRDTDDWHPADVLAALKKRGHSLAGLSVANGYHPTAAGKALKQPWPAMERLLAEAIGVAPWDDLAQPVRQRGQPAAAREIVMGHDARPDFAVNPTYRRTRPGGAPSKAVQPPYAHAAQHNSRPIGIGSPLCDNMLLSAPRSYFHWSLTPPA